MMSDIEFIIYLCERIRDIICDGDEPDLDIIESELDSRDIDFEKLFSY